MCFPANEGMPQECERSKDSEEDLLRSLFHSSYFDLESSYGQTELNDVSPVHGMQMSTRLYPLLVRH